MRISVIVPCYNCARTLPAQLEALSRQNWRGDWEILVVDNGSRDRTLSVARRLRHSIPNLKILQAKERKGYAHARNVGVRESSGDCLLFCDGNDVVHSRWLETMAAALAEHPFVAGRLVTTDINAPWTVGARPLEMQWQETATVETFGHLPWASASNLGIHRSLFEKAGGFDEDFTALEEADLSWRVQKLGADLTPVDEAVVHFRLRKTHLGIFHQALVYSINFVRLADVHRDAGFTPPVRSAVSRAGLWLLAWLCLFTFQRKYRGRLMWKLGWSAGWILGTVRYRWLRFSPSASLRALKDRLLKINKQPKHQPHLFP